MPTARNRLTKGLWIKPLLLAAALALLSGSASAQMSSGRPPRPGDAPDNGPSPLEQQRQKQIDNDYKSATKNVPNQKPKDPWGDVRPTPTGKSQSKNESLTPYHRDSFNRQTPQ
jgi:hypothetical protein